MLSGFITASFLLGCLVIFFVVNLFNITRTLRSRREKVKEVDAEVSRPGGFFLSLAIVGTVSFFLISVVYPLLVFTDSFQLIQLFPLQLVFQHDLLIQLIGMLLQTVGYILFLWSVLERGRDPSVLVTWGPFRYVRHPSYSGYFLMFSGLFLTLLNLIALVPLMAIPGYVSLTTCEEQLLIARFGNEYVQYQKRTGRFLPKIRHIFGMHAL
jgi:protein-S-isoprenylcysteine O-methyltransferase Ste14